VRLSDFLLWQSDFSVTYFTGVLWPDFSFRNLLAGIFYYQRHRRQIDLLTGQLRLKGEADVAAAAEGRVRKFLRWLEAEEEERLRTMAAENDSSATATL
jgi:hypothetical protein